MQALVDLAQGGHPVELGREREIGWAPRGSVYVIYLKDQQCGEREGKREKFFSAVCGGCVLPLCLVVCVWSALWVCMAPYVVKDANYR